MVVLAEQMTLPLPTPASTSVVAGPARSAAPSVVNRLREWGATPVFDAYWRFAADRQLLLIKRLAGMAPPWTDDQILAHHRFTNPYRFTDRVSQYLIRNVQYDHEWDQKSLVLRTLFFKIFNRIDTWDLVRSHYGELSAQKFDPTALTILLDDARARGMRIYSAAYIIPNPPYGHSAKHANHLSMLEAMWNSGAIDALTSARGLEELFNILINVPSIGPFLAFQYAVDINYSAVTDSDEWDFVVPGPGARDGLRKCFSDLPPGSEAEAIHWVAQTQEDHFRRLGIEFAYVFERQLRPIDCQNLFCEIDKYARVRYPMFVGKSGRTRIKQGYSALPSRMVEPLMIPPKWRNA